MDLALLTIVKMPRHIIVYLEIFRAFSVDSYKFYLLENVINILKVVNGFKFKIARKVVQLIFRHVGCCCIGIVKELT